MKTTILKPSFCPFCFKMLDAASSVRGEEVPQPGDFTVCISCCNVLLFDDDMKLLASSLEDIPMHSRLDFAKVVTACKQITRARNDTSPSA
jgi:hypothetical protein